MPAPVLDNWSIRDLVAHLGQVYAFVTATVTNLEPEAGALGSEATAPEGDAINEWFGERRNLLLAALSAADEEADVFTFVGTRTVAWWKRRMAHETAVHLWDAVHSIDGPDASNPIDSDLAADGVDEYLEVSLRTSSSRPDRRYPIESLHLHRADGPGEWMLVGDGAGGLTITHEHGKGDAAVRGPAAELVVWIWGRPTAGVEIFGSEAVAAAWHELAP